MFMHACPVLMHACHVFTHASHVSANMFAADAQHYSVQAVYTNDVGPASMQDIPMQLALRSLPQPVVRSARPEDCQADEP